ELVDRQRGDPTLLGVVVGRQCEAPAAGTIRRRGALVDIALAVGIAVDLNRRVRCGCADDDLRARRAGDRRRRDTAVRGGVDADAAAPIRRDTVARDFVAAIDDRPGRWALDRY